MKRLLSLLLVTLAFLPALAGAQGGKYQYSQVKAPLAVEDGKIEVLEFFWYGCIHCYNLEPLVEKWEKTLPKDVEFRRVPAIFNDRWALDAAIFYTFEAMGILGKAHKPFFAAIHQDRLKTDNKQALADWLQKNGIDAKKFDDTLRSFGVQTKVRRAAQLTAAYKIDGTPAMAVHGRYTVSTEQGRSREGMFETVNYLTDVVRKGK
ncbi:MAG TPA: thiol:disulfide interchange protein DsbA/DsbL [Burkholderiales bacterium]